ncbi:hypothetical protein EXW53_21680 [Bacillus mycoides]|uniref:hypothetical protein n=1 Tax=Bacillus mycoides TaxID=1405 RepID=UPI001C02026C|nr:hypothetical protein [Bacillus mycoides]QWH39343.1 hypothetical protein EXW53_21680 [Bacillus mycoides]
MITEQFKAAVRSKDVERVKIMLKNSLMQDLTFNQFKKMLDYTLKFLPNIIEEHDGEIFKSKSDWTKQYASAIKSDLVDNFSAERIEHIKEVQRFSYADSNSNQKASPIPKNDRQPSDESGTNIDSESMVALIAALGVSAASILFGVIKGMSIVSIATTTVIASCVVGGVTYYLVKKS